ncbi:MAG: hypothetical protein R6W68_08660 [Ignavibacteriaceae bacterium]
MNRYFQLMVFYILIIQPAYRQAGHSIIQSFFTSANRIILQSCNLAIFTYYSVRITPDNHC